MKKISIIFVVGVFFLMFFVSVFNKESESIPEYSVSKLGVGDKKPEHKNILKESKKSVSLDLDEEKIKNDIKNNVKPTVESEPPKSLEFPVQVADEQAELPVNNGSALDLFVVDDSGSSTLAENKPLNAEFSQYGRYIVLDESVVRNLGVGQMVTIPLDVPRIMEVKKVERRKNGSSKVTFSLPGYSKIYRGFLSVGRNSTFGRIVTPEGGYELEIYNGHGWIVDTKFIDKKMPKYGSGVIIPSY